MTAQIANPTESPQLRLSRRRQMAIGQAISFLMKQGVENPDVVSLAAGLVDPTSLPVEESRIAVDKLLSNEQRARQALQYGTTPGSEPLRRVYLRHFAGLEGASSDDPGFDVDRMILTTGSQQFLSLVGETLLDPGDICLVAAPTYFVFLGLLNGLGTRAIPIDTDENGMRMDALEETLERLERDGELDRVKLIYLVSDYENPSGVSLSAERRELAVDIARRWSKLHRLFILEDAAYRELRYDGPRNPSVWSFDTAGEHVIISQTFSKTYSPGIRVGYGVVPHDLVEPICDRKGNEDFGSANFNQHLVATVLEEGLYENHVVEVCDSYRVKRDAMLAAADKYFADIPGVSWVHPHGGLYVWMTLPDAVETGFNSPLFHQAVHVEKMMYVPGEICQAGPADIRPKNEMRLSYGVEDPAGIDLGIQRLANAVKAVLK